MTSPLCAGRGDGLDSADSGTSSVDAGLKESAAGWDVPVFCCLLDAILSKVLFKFLKR